MPKLKLFEDPAPSKALAHPEVDHESDPYWYVPPPEPVQPAPEKYDVIVRGPDDPERLSRRTRQSQGYDSEGWKTINSVDVEGWKELILQLLRDGEPRTFNCMVLELTNYQYTADIAFEMNPEKALWSLVDDKKIKRTKRREIPIYFSARRRR